jgi:hypothetical protein
VSTFSGVCSDLDECCPDLETGAQIEECQMIGASGAGSACEAELEMLAAEGFCIGGGPVPIFDAGGPTPVMDAGVIGASCVLGGDCEPGSVCTNLGAGPCDSDQQLSCGPSALWIADGFPCSSSIPSCGFGSGSCNETCDCENGLMVCTGDCPDAGPANP